MVIPVTLTCKPFVPCDNAPDIATGPTNATTQEPTCENAGVWITQGVITLTFALPANYEIEWWYTNNISMGAGWILHQTTTSLTNTFPGQSYSSDWGTNGTLGSPQTLYRGHRAKIKHDDFAGICDEATSSQDERTVEECEA